MGPCMKLSKLTEIMVESDAMERRVRENAGVAWREALGSESVPPAPLESKSGSSLIS